MFHSPSPDNLSEPTACKHVARVQKISLSLTCKELKSISNYLNVFVVLAVAMVAAHGKSKTKLANFAAAKSWLRARRLNPRMITPDQLVGTLDKFAQERGRTPMHDGDYMAAASTVAGLANGLGQLMETVGRSGELYLAGVARVGPAATGFATAAVGNPMHAPVVTDYLHGYRTLSFDNGNDPVAAVIFVNGKLDRLHAYRRKCALDLAISRFPAGRAVLVCATAFLRDAAHAALATAGFERASEAGKLRRECLSFRGDGALVIDFERAERGQNLEAHTGRGKKQDKRGTTPAYVIAPDASEAAAGASAHCPIALLREYVGAMDEYRLWPARAAGEPHYLFLLLARGGKEFQNKPLNAGAVTARMRSHLTAMEEYNGETSHSLKRTGLAESPLSDIDAAGRAALAPETVAYYRDQRRPTRALEPLPASNNAPL
jgi:hypothetical protein